MPRNPRRSALRKYLEEMDRESLIEEIERIVERFDEVRKFYLADLSGNPLPLIQSARNQLERAFRFANGQYRNPKASKLNKIIRDFERISLFREDVLDLLLFRLELSIGYLNHLDLTTGAFYNSAHTAFQKAIALARDLQAEEKYFPILQALPLHLKDRTTRALWQKALENPDH